MRILICEDDPSIADLMRDALLEAGYEVVAKARRLEAEAELVQWNPDLLLLDVMLPESSEAGWELLSSIRERGIDVAVIIVTALSRVDDRVRALTSGADDFIGKPFSLEELKARVHAVLRRTRPAVTDLSIHIDDIRKEVQVGSRPVSLSPKEYQLLRLLASSPGRVFSNEEIRAELWPSGRSYATEQDVQKYVYLLRRKIERDPKEPEIVVTVRGFGYRLAV
jgi:two-component system OmpR family response regulator